MFNKFGKEKCTFVAVGALAGALVCKFLHTKTARNLAVKGLAQGIILKDNVLEEVNNIKDEAEDIVCEAKEVAKCDKA